MLPARAIYIVRHCEKNQKNDQTLDRNFTVKNSTYLDVKKKEAALSKLVRAWLLVEDFLSIYCSSIDRSSNW
jgi:hypothetical protein